LQERVLDVRDVCYQLLQQIYGEQRFPAPGKLTQPTVCLADDLTPGQFLELDKTLLKGLLLKSGGTTSHTVILARSFNIPTLVGVDSESLQQWRNQPVFIDGNAGAVVVNASDAVTRYYQQEARVQQAIREQQSIWLTVKPEPPTACESRLPPTLPMRWKLRQHSQRRRRRWPVPHRNAVYGSHQRTGENELYNIFCQALECANGRSIIVRTMDIGGDKPVDYLNIPARTTRSSATVPCVFMKSIQCFSPPSFGRSCAPPRTAA
jgi:fructose-specific PTS system IIA-like component